MKAQIYQSADLVDRFAKHCPAEKKVGITTNLRCLMDVGCASVNKAVLEGQ